MDKLIGISGAHGAGKTSLLHELVRRGYNVDDFKVSRQVQKDRGWENLSIVRTSFETMCEFQIDVLKRKLKHDLKLKQEGHGSVILTERTFLDIYAYASYWTWEFADISKSSDYISIDVGTRFLMWFRNECEKAQLEVYDGVVLLPMMSHIQQENDPHRAMSDVSNTIVYDSVVALSTAINRPKCKIPSLALSSVTVEDRADDVENFLRTI